MRQSIPLLACPITLVLEVFILLVAGLLLQELESQILSHYQGKQRRFELPVQIVYPIYL